MLSRHLEPLSNINYTLCAMHSTLHVFIYCIHYLYCLLVVDGDEGADVNASDLEAAANDNTFAAVQYKAMRLQDESAHRRPEMVMPLTIL